MVSAYGSGRTAGSSRGGRFSDSLLDEIRARTDIVAVIGEYVPLKRRGANYIGLCPFHPEKTPSFTVSQEKQMFYCFGCQTGGNVFSFLTKKENLSFAEAVELLAAKAGVVIPERAALERNPEARAAADRRKEEAESLFKVVDHAARYFQQALRKSAEAERARAYIARRGIKPESVEAFRLGYSLQSWDHLGKYLAGKGYSEVLLERAGLVLRGKEGKEGHYDRFRGRLMFTISDQRGRPIGFGARALADEDQPKYLNSPETPLFSKGRALYALHLAAPSIRRNGMALVVEGYMDVIACHEFGFDFAVASMGTAFTADQARALRRLTDTVVTAFDADTAGAQATLRGLEVLTAAGFRVKVAEIPGGKDPDECLRAEGGPAAFRRAVEEAVSLPEYRFRLAERRHDLTTIDGRVAAVNELLPVLAGIENYLERNEYIRDFARRLPVPEDALRLELGRYLKASTDPRRRGRPADGSGGGWASGGAGGPVAEAAAAGEAVPGGVRDSIARSRNNKEIMEPSGGAGRGERARQAVPRQVHDAERTLLALMVRGEDSLPLVLTGLLEAADWCAGIGLAVAREAAAAAETEVGVGAAAPAEAEGLTITEAAVLDWFLAPEHRRLARVVLELARDGPIEPAALVDVLAASDAGWEAPAGPENLAARVLFEAQELAIGEAETEQAIRDCLRVLKEHRLNSRIEELHRRISDLEREGALAEPERAETLREYGNLVRALIDLKPRIGGATGR